MTGERAADKSAYAIYTCLIFGCMICIIWPHTVVRIYVTGLQQGASTAFTGDSAFWVGSTYFLVCGFRTVFYGQYQCYGPGAKEAGRVGWSHELTAPQAAAFSSLSFIDGNSWVTAWSLIKLVQVKSGVSLAPASLWILPALPFLTMFLISGNQCLQSRHMIDQLTDSEVVILVLPLLVNKLGHRSLLRHHDELPCEMGRLVCKISVCCAQVLLVQE